MKIRFLITAAALLIASTAHAGGIDHGTLSCSSKKVSVKALVPIDVNEWDVALTTPAGELKWSNDSDLIDVTLALGNGVFVLSLPKDVAPSFKLYALPKTVRSGKDGKVTFKAILSAPSPKDTDSWEKMLRNQKLQCSFSTVSIREP